MRAWENGNGRRAAVAGPLSFFSWPSSSRLVRRCGYHGKAITRVSPAYSSIQIQLSALSVASHDKKKRLGKQKDTVTTQYCPRILCAGQSCCCCCFKRTSLLPAPNRTINGAYLDQSFCPAISHPISTQTALPRPLPEVTGGLAAGKPALAIFLQILRTRFTLFSPPIGLGGRLWKFGYWFSRPLNQKRQLSYAITTTLPTR